jgi:hypothetical protein
VAAPLGEPGADHRLARDRHEPLYLWAVHRDPLAAGHVAPDRALRQHHHPRAAAARLDDHALDAPEPAGDIAAEAAGDGRERGE